MPASDPPPVNATIAVTGEPAEPPPPIDGGWWLSFVLAAVVLGLMVLGVRASRRRRPPGRATDPWWTQLHTMSGAKPSHAVQRLSSTRLSARHSLHVVIWDGRRMLLGCSDQSIELLAESSPRRGVEPVAAEKNPAKLKGPP